MVEVKEESEKVGLKLNIQKTKIIASGPVTSREIDGKTVERVTHFTLQSWTVKKAEHRRIDAFELWC